jgi:hypothetical protein
MFSNFSSLRIAWICGVMPPPLAIALLSACARFQREQTASRLECMGVFLNVRLLMMSSC